MKQSNNKTIEEELKMTSFIDEYQKAYLNLLFTTNSLSVPINKSLKSFGLTSSQYNVLRILRGQKGRPIPAMEIQRRMVYPSSNVTRILDKLLEKGLIECNACPENRRKNNVIISSLGLQVLEETDQVPMAAYRQMRKVLSPEEATELNRLLDLLRIATQQ